MESTEARTGYGMIRGEYGKNGRCIVFKGVPYARPPIGELRFAPPEEPEPWDGIRDCTEFGPAPVQPLFEGESIKTGEDCLNLNIYTPAEKTEEKMPVMVWIFGGAFAWGSASDPLYQGESICDNNCILVTVNYRVNVFGFFNTPEIEKKNGGARCFGILDQIAAVKWVKENISAFGGNPEKIMIFGYSAGGISVRMLLTSPLTGGLFSRAVVHSGGGMNEGDLVRSREEFTKICTDTLEHVGWTYEDIMTRDAEEVMQVMLKGASEIMPVWEPQYFQPFIDGYSIVEVPGISIAEGRYHDIPVMCGTVAGDTWMFTRKVREELNNNINYLRGFVISPQTVWGRRAVELGLRPIYSYFFERRQPKTDMKFYTHGKPPYGADTPHGSDLQFIMGTLDSVDPGYTDADREIAEIIRKYWTNFARNGNPNGEGLPEWPLFEKGSEKSIYFGDDLPYAENLVRNEDEERVMKFSAEHPGMLCSLEGF